MEKGLDINSVENGGSSALHWAAFSGSELSMNYIIAWGGDIHQKDIRGYTPLHMAVISDHPVSFEIVKELIKHGAFINAKDDNGRPPLVLALENLKSFNRSIFQKKKYISKYSISLNENPRVLFFIPNF